MNIQINDSIGFSEEDTIKLVTSLFQNRKPKEGSFDYGFESFGAMGIVVGIQLKHPIQVYQTNKRKSNKSSIKIKIERHYPIT